MELAQALDAIKKSIAQGNLEEAYNQLVALLDSSEDYAELADIARVNQADLYQLKAQTLKGTISPEDARLTTNQLADKALLLIRQLETGKVFFEEEIKPTSRKALRYYIIGGIVALVSAFLVWQFWDYKKSQDTCPVFSQTAELKVMILPFKQTGTQAGGDPAFDIMDDLNDLIEQTPGLRVRALADVNEQYNIDQDYPNSAQAVEIAQGCNVQMLVWGKVNQFGRRSKDYTVDVRYRLIDAGGVRYAGDTTINRLLAVTEEANWTSDVRAISRLLYMVLANQLQVPIAANILQELGTGATARLESDTLAPPVDTSTSFVLADYYIMKNEKDSAIAQYNKVLAYFPENSTALTKRGALYFQKEDYKAAARDLGAVTSCSENTADALQKTRIKAYLESEQPEKAKKELETARENKSLDGAWLNEATSKVRDSLSALKVRRDQMERMATKTSSTKVRVSAAKANLGLGETESALMYANEALKKDPKNLEAVQIAVDAQLQRGDTAKAASTIREAERAGADVKNIHFTPIRKEPLQDRKQR
ncbi:MAG: tetratricopeptide repeat protein [Saprospiraceae bacterium]|nr:tetratricopeptide repeat protein [Lewinellaceae bacterium]